MMGLAGRNFTPSESAENFADPPGPACADDQVDHSGRMRCGRRRAHGNPAAVRGGRAGERPVRHAPAQLLAAWDSQSAELFQSAAGAAGRWKGGGQYKIHINSLPVCLKRLRRRRVLLVYPGMGDPIPERGFAMDVRLGDVLVMKKPHPCGGKRWLVLRTGMDFRLRCLGCGHEVLLPRSRAEKNIREVVRETDQKI